MGVYSNSRFINESFIDAPEPDLSYSGPNAANKIIAEMVANDTAFFDAIIVNDIHEACLVNAINEGASHLEPELYALQEATTGGIFAKIKEFLMSIWKKISGLIMAFINKISGQVTTDNKKLVKKFEKQINSKDSALKKMEFKFSDRNKSDWGYETDIISDKSFVGTDYNKIMSHIDDGINLYVNKFSNTGESAFKVFAEELSDFIKEIESANFEYTVYGKYLGNVAPDSTSGLANACHKYFFKDEETKRGEFNKYQSEITDTLNNSAKNIKDFNKDKKDIDKWFKDQISYYDKISTKFNTKEKVDTTITATSRSTNKDLTLHDKASYNDGHRNTTTYKVDGVDKTANQLISKAASTCKQYYSKLQTCIIGLLDEKMAALQFHIKQCRRVWIQAASYTTNHESVLMDAIGEAADLETDQMLNAIN